MIIKVYIIKDFNLAIRRIKQQQKMECNKPDGHTDKWFK